MENNKEDYYSITDILQHTKLYLIYLRKKILLLILAFIIGIGTGVFYYYNQKPKYEAVCTFILEEKQGGMGSLGSIASQFGFDVGGLTGGGSIFAGDNILDILKSKKVVQEVLLSTVSNQECSMTLADLYLEFSGFRKKWEKVPTLASISFKDINIPMNSVQDSVLNIIYDGVIKKNLIADRINKKGTIIKVQVTSTNDRFAKLLTERLVEEASKMYLNIKTGTAQANIAKMQRRSDSLLMLLNNKSYTAAVSQPLDINPGIRSAIVPVEIATRDKTVLATLYAEVTKNLEASKLLLSQQTPIIQLLDKPGSSLYDNKKSIFLLMIIFSFAAAIGCLSFISVQYFIGNIDRN